MTETVPIFLHTSSFEWQVKNIFHCPSLASEPFQFCGVQWKLLLGRRGYHLCISLRNVSGGKIETTGRIFIRTRIKDRNKLPMFQRCTYVDVLNFSTQLIYRLTEFSREKDKMLSDDDMTFLFSFEYERDHFDNFDREEKSTQTSLTVDPVPRFESLSLDLSRLLDDHALSDVTFRCGDRTIPAHRAILSARSEVFSAMLRSDMSESRGGVITIADIDPPTVEQLVQYIHSGSIPELSVNSAQRLYEAADKYAVEPLKAQCSEFMKENLIKENACDILVVADDHSDADLKECAVAFIIGTELLLQENWKGFRAKHPALAFEVYDHACAAKRSSE